MRSDKIFIELFVKFIGIIFCTHKYNQLYIKKMKEQITYDIFNKVDIRLGTVVSVKKKRKSSKTFIGGRS